MIKYIRIISIVLTILFFSLYVNFMCVNKYSHNMNISYAKSSDDDKVKKVETNKEDDKKDEEKDKNEEDEEKEPTDFDYGKIDGIKMGEIDGKSQGKIDYSEGLSSEYTRNFPTTVSLKQKYNLDREIKEYVYGFISGYVSVYEKEYNKSYRESFSAALTDNTFDNEEVKYEIIDMYGGKVISADKNVNLEFEEGSVYLENKIRIENVKDRINKYELGNRYVQASDIYNIEVDTEDGYMGVYKEFELTIKHVGNHDNVGIYKRTPTKWIYYPTEVLEDNTLKAVINEQKFYGGEFVVLFDKRERNMSDIDGNWAEEEIAIVVKRGYINGYSEYGETIFKPDNEITREEFSVMLYNFMGWSVKNINANDIKLYFLDKDKIGSWARKSVYIAVSEGIINGYDDGKFKPHNKINYKEIEWLIQRAYKEKGYGDFSWDQIAQIIMDEKGEVSNGLFDKTGKITRAEVAYMFYILERGY